MRKFDVVFNKEETEPKPTKIVNLFEDMNPHDHDDASYQKMLDEQKVKKSDKK